MARPGKTIRRHEIHPDEVPDTPEALPEADPVPKRDEEPVPAGA